jgi:hypothetical protein
MGESTEKQDKILNSYKTKVEAGKYTLVVQTIERYWAGHDSGKMEDMPGTFLDTMVSLDGISGELSPLEALALELKVNLLEKSGKEITNEPKGYAELYHNQFVEKVKKDPNEYTQCIRGAVKAKL